MVVYVAEAVGEDLAGDGQAVDRLQSLGVAVKASPVPEEARWLFYGGKPFAAAAAETDCERDKAVLVWLDYDTVVLSEPEEFALAPSISLAYTPVMHNRSGSLAANPPDRFWSRIYEKLAITEDMLFPMVTPADNQTIRAYFHCGQMVLRPQKGILRRWAQDFETLYRDPELVGMCRQDEDQRIFLHQAALTGAVLHRLDRSEMVSLSDRYNYPIFFERGYGATRVFDSIEDVRTIRCVVPPEKMGNDWPSRLSGPVEKIAWLKERLV
jgi:hypothetical protein